MHKKIGNQLLITLLATFLFAMPTTVKAESNKIHIAVSPPKQEFSAKPGAHIQKTIRFYNQTSGVMEGSITIADFIVKNNNSPEFITNTSTANTNVSQFFSATWVTTSDKTLSIQPHSYQDILLDINIPHYARPGGHYFAVIFTPTLLQSRSGSYISQTKITAQLASLVSITIEGNYTIAGHIQSMKIKSLSEYGPLAVAIAFKNTGDIHIRPKAFVNLTNMFGYTVDSYYFDEKNIFPDEIAYYKTQLGKKGLFGRYTVTFTISYNKDQTYSSSRSIWVIPWRAVTVAILILIIILLIFKPFQKKNY